jgi:hypothetical protein
MRVAKKSGQFVVVDEPMRVEGKAATNLLAEIRRSDESGPDAKHQRFLAECERVYKTAKRP